MNNYTFQTPPQINNFFFVLLPFPGKKARTFDLSAIFEQTRRTAIERSQHVLGKCQCPQQFIYIRLHLWHLADAFIQSDLHLLKERQQYISVVHKDKNRAGFKHSLARLIEHFS